MRALTGFADCSAGQSQQGASLNRARQDAIKSVTKSGIVSSDSLYRSLRFARHPIDPLPWPAFKHLSPSVRYPHSYANISRVQQDSQRGGRATWAASTPAKSTIDGQHLRSGSAACRYHRPTSLIGRPDPARHLRYDPQTVPGLAAGTAEASPNAREEEDCVDHRQVPP
jgi:hypothetical protein